MPWWPWQKVLFVAACHLGSIPKQKPTLQINPKPYPNIIKLWKVLILFLYILTSFCTFCSKISTLNHHWAQVELSMWIFIDISWHLHRIIFSYPRTRDRFSIMSIKMIHSRSYPNQPIPQPPQMSSRIYDFFLHNDFQIYQNFIDFFYCNLKNYTNSPKWQYKSL